MCDLFKADMEYSTKYGIQYKGTKFITLGGRLRVEIEGGGGNFYMKHPVKYAHQMLRHNFLLSTIFK